MQRVNRDNGDVNDSALYVRLCMVEFYPFSVWIESQNMLFSTQGQLLACQILFQLERVLLSAYTELPGQYDKG